MPGCAASLSRDRWTRPLKRALPYLFLAAITIAAYSNSFTASWHLDDFDHVIDNTAIKNLENFPRYFTDPATFTTNARAFRPLQLLSLALNYRLSGTEVFSYHLTNFALHFIVGVILVLFTGKVTRSLEPDLSSKWMPWLTGTLFILHPVQVESVTYISSRSSLLSTLFILLSLYSFCLYLTQSRGTGLDRRPSRHHLYLLSLVFCLLGLLTKELSVVVPLLVLLLGFVFDLRDGRRLPTPRTVLYAIPFGLLSILYLWFRASLVGLDAAGALGIATFEGYGNHLLRQAAVAGYYLKLLLFPVNLNFDHSTAFLGLPWIAAYILFGPVLIVCATGHFYRTRRPLPLLAIGWFWICLLPTSLSRLNVTLNEHRLYLPGIGLAIILPWLLAGLAGGVDLRLARRLPLAGFLAALIILAPLTWVRNAVFETEETLWSDVLAKNPSSGYAYNSLGMVHYRQGRMVEAEKLFRAGIDISPENPSLLLNLANVLRQRGRLADADSLLTAILGDQPKNHNALVSLAAVRRDEGRTSEAITLYRLALLLRPDSVEALYNLAFVYFDGQRFPEAVTTFSNLVRLTPGDPKAHYGLAWSQYRSGNTIDAVDSMSRALDLSSSLGEPPGVTDGIRRELGRMKNPAN